MATDAPIDPHGQTEQGEVSYPTLGSYRLLNLLGEGGMGRVYLAKHLVSGSFVALKVIRPELTIDRSTVRRFIAEARTVSRIGHPNIVRVLDVAEPSSGAALYYAMEYLTGIDLRRELQAGSMLLPRAVDIGLQICEALQAVHDAGVIHRDLKPANIFLIAGEDGPDLVKVLDFGLAKLESADSSGSTTSGHLLGTPAYMSPEQAAGDRAGRQSDIYSLGVILYEMFTGRRPFEASSFGGYVVQHLTTAPIAPTAFSPPGVPLPAEVDRILLRCLQKRPSRRYASPADLATDLRQLVPRRTLRPSMAIGPVRGRPSRNRAMKAVALSTAGGLVAVAIYALLGSGAPKVAPATPAPAVTRAAPVTSPAAAELGPAAALDAGRPTVATTSAPEKTARVAGSPRRKTEKVRAGGDSTRAAKKQSLDHVTMDPF
jgi:serine/threonine protein kinase